MKGREGFLFVSVLLLTVPSIPRAHALAEKQAENAGKQEKEPSFGVLDCALEENPLECLSDRLGRKLDEIESDLAGEKGEAPISALIENTGELVADLLHTTVNNDPNQDYDPEATRRNVQEGSSDSPVEEEEDSKARALGEEARRKKFGKKKKKHLQKLLGLAMLIKAKLGLILQLISTHFQLKFFILAIVNLILNATKFWLDLKKAHHPSKVIYYEHAQHQHHYDHDDHEHSGYWGRSANDSPHDLAYNAHKQEN